MLVLMVSLSLQVCVCMHLSVHEHMIGCMQTFFFPSVCIVCSCNGVSTHMDRWVVVCNCEQSACLSARGCKAVCTHMYTYTGGVCKGLHADPKPFHARQIAARWADLHHEVVANSNGISL